MVVPPVVLALILRLLGVVLARGNSPKIAGIIRPHEGFVEPALNGLPEAGSAVHASSVHRIRFALRAKEQVVSMRWSVLVRIAIALLLSSAIGAEGAQAATGQAAVVIRLEPYLRAQEAVHAVVGGRSGTFLFDTGQGVSSFSPEFADDIGCKPWGQITGFRMSGERVDAQHCDNITFELDGVSLHAPAVGILDVMKFMGPDVPHLDGALGLDLFAGQIITIVPRRSVILETPASLAKRIAHARELPVRIVRDVEGIALTVDGAVQTPDGLAWMELDSGNDGPVVVADHIAGLLGLNSDMQAAEEAQFTLANGMVVKGPTRTRDLIMDGNIGAQFLNHYVLTLDLKDARAWLSPVPTDGAD